MVVPVAADHDPEPGLKALPKTHRGGPMCIRTTLKAFLRHPREAMIDHLGRQVRS